MEADYVNHINKWDFDVPVVCGATNLGEALRRITEGAAMIRSKGEKRSATAIASKSVDLPAPFSPTKQVTGAVNSK